MNDWIVANINNPDFNISDFQNIADMDLNNTLMLSKEQYLESDFIKLNPLFQNDLGGFSKNKFDKFYNQKLLEFLEFLNSKFPQTLELDMFDTDITSNSKIRDDEFFIGRGVNPDRQKIGIEGINYYSNPEFSKFELALKSKIWDTEKGEYKNYSPNDKSLTNGILGWASSLFEDPLVLAQWEKEGEHLDPITGQVRKHKKGDPILNKLGTYYYETLNGRSTIGKQVLSAMDTITVDGQGINKYDFFDSDDIEKSVAGVITKNVVSLLPLFVGGPIATAYSAALVAREMSKALPMLYGITTSLFSDSETPEWMNSIAAVGEKFTGGTSLYAKEHVFSVENFGNLIADVALLWGQLKYIAKTINLLRGSKDYMKEAVDNAHTLYQSKVAKYGALAAADESNWMNSNLGKACLKKFLPQAEKATRQSTQLGRDISLAYMAIISNSDVFGDMILHGATRGEAAAVALGSTLGMFAIGKTGLGEIFFDDATDVSTKAARAAIRKEMRELRQVFTNISKSNDTSTNKILKYISTAAQKSKNFLRDYSKDLQYHTTNLYQKMGAEGLEEVSEELVADTSKAIYELAGKFGFDTSVTDVGSWDNMLERYSMSLIGGALGGGIFYGKEVFDGKSFKRDKSNEELVTLIRNGHTEELKSVLNNLKEKGKLGNTKLSANKYELSDDLKVVWLTTQDKKDSQNNAIADIINDKINALESIINNNLVGLSDELLFEQMILSEDRFQKYQNISHVTNYYLDFNNILQDLISSELDLKRAQLTRTGEIDGTLIKSDETLTKLSDIEQLDRLANINSLLDKVEKSRLKMEDFLSGSTSLDYARKLNFLMDPNLYKEFLPLNLELIWKKHFKDTPIKNATEELLNKFMNEILPEEHKQVYENKELLTLAWNKFILLEQEIIPNLNKLAEDTPKFKTWSDKIQNLLNSNNLFPEKLEYFLWDYKLPNESKDEFNSRNSKLKYEDAEETDFDFINRQILRQSKIDQLNDQKDQELIQKISQYLNEVDYNVDPIIERTIKKILPRRVKDIINYKINNLQVSNNIKTLLKLLKIDLSNSDEVLKNVEVHQRQSFINILNLKIKELKELELTFSDGELINGEDFFKDVLLEDTVSDIIDENDDNFLELDEESRKKVKEVVEPIGEILGDVDLVELLSEEESIKQVLLNPTDKDSDESSEYVNQFNQNFEQYISTLKNDVQNILQSINNNAIFNFNKNLKNTVKNPILELIKAFAEKTVGGNFVPKIEEILSIIEDNYNNLDDIGSLQLDDVQEAALHKMKDILNLINTYLYAAASTSTMNTPIGHNKIFNEFAKKHQEVIDKWEKLPEIDSDYLAMYLLLIALYTREINWWIDLHNHNTINKRDQFEKTDAAFSKSLKESLQKAIDNEAFNLDIDDEKYNLLEGLNEINSSEDDFITLFNIEKTIYNNFQKALQKSKLSVKDFLTKSQLLEKVLLNFDDILKLHIAKLTPTLTKDDLTKYDLLQHLSMTLTLDPAKFYGMVKSSVGLNANIAPITAQEYAAKLAIASTNQQFRDIIEYAFIKTGDSRYFAGNTTVITGVAGAGKTLVVARYLKNSYNPDQIIAVGPTETLSSSLGNVLGVELNLTIPKLFNKILGKEGYLRLKRSHDDITWSTNSFTGESEYYTAVFKDFFGEYKLKDNAPLEFVEIKNPPKILIVDEATHLSALEALVLNEYMKYVGGQLILMGDPNLLGYHNGKNGMDNIMEDSIFAVRTPKLITSLRDNNILKLANLEIVKTLLDTVNDNFNNMNDEDWDSYWPIAKKIMSKFNFKVFNDDEINGDLITGSLSPDLIAKLNKEGKTVGFIGNKDNSVTYTKLKEAGFGDKLTGLTIDEMLGLEFDYVIIDTDFKDPDSGLQVKNFLQNLYTLMSRGKEAAIFIDNGLSSIIGNNVVQLYKAKAPSLNDKIDGVSAVDILRQKKLNLLNSLDLSFTEVEGAESEKPQHDLLQDFKNPDDLNVDKKILQYIKDDFDKDVELDTQIIEDSGTLEEYVGESLFTIPCFGDVTLLGIEQLESSSRKGRDGKIYTSEAWKIKTPENGPLRNLQALMENDEEAFWYVDKKRWQKQLYQLKSTILFGYNLNDTVFGGMDKIVPSFIRNKFSQQDWDNGTFELEIRSTDEEILPIGSSMKKVGLEYKGENYIANIVFKVKNKDGRECIFDIAGINNPETLSKNLEIIKDNIREKLNNPKTTNEEKIKLNNILSTIDEQVVKYSNLFESWINQYKANGEFSINVSSAVKLNKTTWFAKRIKPIRLGGYINPNDVKGPKDLNTFRDKNPGIVVSNVYTFTGKELDNLDLSIKGKAVVFVSSNTLLKEDELIKEYIRQKTDPENNTALVRMIVLNNYGMTLSQLYDEDFIQSYQSGEELRKPIKQNFLGLNMFAGMWNFRAALIQFNQALSNWRSKNNYDDNTVRRIILAQDYIFEKSLSGESLINYLKSVNLSEDDIKNLESFNKEDLKNIPTFRLGYSRNNNGFHILEYPLNNSTAYPGKTKANFIAIDPDKAGQFNKLINAIMKSIFSEDKDSLGVRLVKEDKSIWDPKELIDLENSNHKRTLSGLLKFNNLVKSIEIKYKDKVMAFPEGLEWSAIPGLIANIIKTTTFYQYNPDQLSGSELECATIYLHNKDGDDREAHILKTLIGTWFSGNDPILKTRANTTNPVSSHPDRTLANMFDLMFHGTVEDIHKGDPLKVTGVFAPNGFLVNPDISRIKAGAGASDIVQETLNGTAVFYKIDTPEGLFTADVDIRSAGLALSLTDLFSIHEENSLELGDDVLVLKNEYPVLKKLRERAKEEAVENIDFDEDVVNHYNQKYASTISSNLLLGNTDLLNMLYYYKYKENEDVQELTLELFIRELRDDIESILINNQKILVTTTNNGELVFNSLTRKLSTISDLPDNISMENEEINGEDDSLENSGTIFDRKVILNNQELSLEAALLGIFNNPTILTEENTETNSDIIDDFRIKITEIINTAKKLSDDATKSLISEISLNEDYDEIITYLEENYKDVYNKLFEEC